LDGLKEENGDYDDDDDDSDGGDDGDIASLIDGREIQSLRIVVGWGIFDCKDAMWYSRDIGR
jgi:hypothetical protein